MKTTIRLLLPCLCLCACQARPELPAAKAARPGLAGPQEAGLDGAALGVRPAHARRLEERLTWTEAGREQALWIEPELLLAFGLEPSDLGARVPGARLERELGPTVRLWRLPAGVDASGVLPLLSDMPAISPALRQGPGSGGPLVGLPGGVLLTLAAGADPLALDAELAAAGSRVLARWELASGPLLHVDGPAGRACLEQTERLGQLTGVAAATPNLWVERASR